MGRDNDKPAKERGPDPATLLLHAVEHTHDLVLLLDSDGRLTYANAVAVATYGYPRDDLLALTIHDLDPDFPADTWAQHWASLKRCGTLTVNVRHLTRDGRALPIEINDSWVEFDGTEYSIVVARELTHRPVTDERTQLMKFSVDRIDESVFWIGPDARVIYANDAASRNLGYASDELVGMTVPDLDPNFPEEIWPLHWQELAERQRLNFETEHRRKDGTVFPVEVTTNYIKIGDREYNCAFSRDITERKLAEGQLRQMATHDSLTGLPNKTLLNDRLGQALAYASRNDRKLAVLFLDVDHMKQVNVAQGHATGDQVLAAVARRLQAPLRAIDTVAHWGGDAFVVLIPDLAEPEYAGDVGQRLLDAMHLPLAVDGHDLALTASIGIAIYPQDGFDAETLFKNADIAMYRAKELGGDNAQYFSADLDPDTADHIARLLELRHALRHDELRVHYQPILDATSDRLVGIEALVRWEHPVRGLLLPDDFLATAEASGLIIDLGRHVLRHGCAQLRTWRDAGLEVPPLSINLSPRQLRDPELLHVVEDALEHHGLKPGDLVFDLPPGLLASDGGLLFATVKRLVRLGVGFAFDDIGHSPTHLQVLQQLSRGTVKLDARLIAALGGSTDSTPLVDALTGAAHRLGTQVLAEGVEDGALLDRVRTLGCDLVAGFVTGRPMPADAFVDWFERRAGPADTPPG
jgi:diguanylate cyclase (GGDEF)-like protein/PAS domain S-box-containing protein